jgi:glycosyltransferase involved in cell wall biosynthesis
MDRLRIWLITVGEPLPTDPGTPRLLRTGAFASFLAARGHEVTWWSSTFDHAAKRHRAAVGGLHHERPGLRVILLHGRDYPTNVCLARIGNHRQTAAQFAEFAPREPVPDLILSSLPTLELCRQAVDYGRCRGVPVVLDVRDLWPDIFLELAPRGFRWIARLVLGSHFELARSSCRDASALIGINPAFVDWGLRLAGRPRTPTDRDFPLAYDSSPPSTEALFKAARFWDGLGIREGDPCFRLCFFGAISRQFDLETVLAGLRLLLRQGVGVQAVFCGAGDRLNRHRRASESLGPAVVFPGWVDGPAIWCLMRRSACGLAPYFSSPSFESSLPNKAVEYLSAGLPLVSSLQGALRKTLEERGCGLTYANGSPMAFADAVRTLGSDPVRLREMGRRAAELFRESFTAERVFGAMERHLEQLAVRR